MKEFMLAYYGGNKPSSQEEGMKHRQNWQEWVASLGDTVLNPGTPFTQSVVINKDGAKGKDYDPSMNGFAIIKAESIDQAMEVAMSDPFLQMEGDIRISELMSMN